MLLLPVEVLDGELVETQRFAPGHPASDRFQRDGQQFRIEPGLGLRQPRKQDLHLLPLGIDGVVALILVVLKRREIPDPIGELPKLLGQSECVQERVRAAGKSTFQRGVPRDAGFELLVALVPGVPVGKDIRQIPFEAFGHVLATTGPDLRWLGSRNIGWGKNGQRAHLITIPSTP